MRSCRLAKQKYLITNLVYGSTYTKLFLNNHVKSLLDPSNLDAVIGDYEIEYHILTDKETLRELAYHPNMIALSKKIKVSSNLFTWPPGAINKFAFRYGLLLDLFRHSVKKALEQDAWLTQWVADLVVAQEFFPRVLSRMADGHGAVFVLPLRSASEAVSPKLQEFHYALKDKELFNIGYECLHPLWNACHWNSPQFTKLPFTLLWQGVGGLLARTFSTTPIVFKPRQEMVDSRGMIDGDVPALCDNPYWAHDWINAPVIGVEPLICYYPPFANRPASTQLVRDFMPSLDQSQYSFLNEQCFYPSRADVEFKPETLIESDNVVREILSERSW